MEALIRGCQDHNRRLKLQKACVLVPCAPSAEPWTMEKSAFEQHQQFYSAYAIRASGARGFYVSRVPLYCERLNRCQEICSRMGVASTLARKERICQPLWAQGATGNAVKNMLCWGGTDGRMLFTHYLADGLVHLIKRAEVKLQGRA